MEGEWFAGRTRLTREEAIRNDFVWYVLCPEQEGDYTFTVIHTTSETPIIRFPDTFMARINHSGKYFIPAKVEEQIHEFQSFVSNCFP
jgi:hypothetical protein